MNLNPARERQRRYERTHRGEENERRRRWRARQAAPMPAHGKTRAEIQTALEQQNKCCAICKTVSSGGRGWHGDSDRRTGAFRGVLCADCSAGLELFRARVKTLRAAIYYLELHAHRQAQLQALL